MQQILNQFILQFPRNILATLVVLFTGVQLAACGPGILGMITHTSEHLNYAANTGLTKPITPSPDSAYLVILRPGHYQLYTAKILDGQNFVTMLTKNSHFVYKTNPGTHHFMAYVAGGHASFINAELEGGKIYFAIVMVVPDGGYRLLPVVPGSEFWPQISHWLSESREAQPNASAYTWFEANKAALDSARNRDPSSTVLRRSDGVDRVP